MSGEILSRRTTPPLAADVLVARVGELCRSLGPCDKVAVGFPGVVRNGVVVRAGNLTAGDAGWENFDLGAALSEELRGEVRIANDADIAALGCSRGVGRELTVTLGTGVGTGLVIDGELQGHLELSEIPFHEFTTLDAAIGEPARKRVSSEEWDRRLVEILHLLDRVVVPDQIWLAGGNARRLTRSLLGDLLERVWVVSEPVGLLGGIGLFS